MAQKETISPDRVYRLWESTQEIIEFATWIPEVVGTEGELIRMGSTLVAELPDVNKSTVVNSTVVNANVVESTMVEVTESIRFIDSDVSYYRKTLNVFRKRHHIKK